MKQKILWFTSSFFAAASLLAWTMLREVQPARPALQSQSPAATPGLGRESGTFFQREPLEAASAPAPQAEVQPGTVRAALQRLHPHLDPSRFPDQSRLDRPAAPLAAWDEVRDEAERGLVKMYQQRLNYTPQQLLAKAVTGQAAGSLEEKIASEAAAREIELDNTKISEMAKELESRGFELVERQRRIEAARLQAVMSRVGSGLYDRFEYIDRPSDAQHSKAGQDVAEVAFWSGNGWVVQTA